jgi:DNA-nicking Smr family endonuclease
MKKTNSKKQKAGAFNQPFQAIRSQIQIKKSPPNLPPTTHVPKPTPPVATDEESLFAQAMAQVVPFAERQETPFPTPKVRQVVSEDAEALARLSDLVSGNGDWDIADTDEFIEGAAPGVNQGLLATLRRGDYAIQGHIDLHGKTKPEAKEAVERFLIQARKEGKRCVLIIHGRGLNSKDNIPVLKESLKTWLCRGAIGRSVLAFSTARVHDGGLGALYVLLRKN